MTEFKTAAARATGRRFACGECGQMVTPTQFHPFTACVRYKKQQARAALPDDWDGKIVGNPALMDVTGGQAQPAPAANGCLDCGPDVEHALDKEFHRLGMADHPFRATDGVRTAAGRAQSDLSGLLKIARAAQDTYVGRHWPNKRAMRRDGIGFGLNDGEHEDRIRRFLYECQPEFLVQYLEVALAALREAEAALPAAGLDVDDVRAALHRAGIGCKPNIPYCRATHRGHAQRIVDELYARLRGGGER